ncbi:Uncharacterised protein [Streptococcus pneumoniae]|nr:Uncharacterised protein [Streptococcus pneumoniae]
MRYSQYLTAYCLVHLLHHTDNYCFDDTRTGQTASVAVDQIVVVVQTVVRIVVVQIVELS